MNDISLEDTNELETIKELQSKIFELIKDTVEPTKEQIQELKSLSDKMSIEADKILTWDDLT